MVYKKQFAAAIKVAGNTLRENGKKVKLPYQSEYSIFLKNQSTVRAMINIVIDGNHITPNGLVLDGGAKVDLERFIENNRKFKFIERTSSIASHLGENSADSTIVIRYAFEKVVPKIETVWVKDVHHYQYPSPFYPPTPYYPSSPQYNILRSSDVSSTNGTISCNAATFSSEASVDEPNDVGITVQGSESNQTFGTVNTFAVENEEHVIEFELLGGDKVTTKNKKICPSCGSKIKSKHQYCPHDGTFLG